MMLDLVFGVVLATSPLNDPMDSTALDGRGGPPPAAAVAATEPAAGEPQSSEAAGPTVFGTKRFGRGGGER